MAELQPTTVEGTLQALKTENVKTGGHTLQLEDRDRVVAMNNTSSATVVVPDDSSIDFPIGSVVFVSRINSGNVEITAASGVTVSKLGSLGPQEEIVLRKRASNNWQLLEEKEFFREASGGSIDDQGVAKSHSFTSTGSDTFTVE